MKIIFAFLFFSLYVISGFTQVKVHSHNDYLQAQTFDLAYQNQVYEIEADVFEVNGELIVAHSKEEINPKNTLKRIYLDRIDSLFNLYKGKISADRKYTFSLMIDFKTPFETTFPVLKKQIEEYQDVFNRNKNNLAVQIVISGNRPAESTFHLYPDWTYFDGLSTVVYDKKDLKKVTMISDNFKTYSEWNGVGIMPEAEKTCLKNMITSNKKSGKPVRLWGAPDTPQAWATLQELGAEIVNTDQIVQCKTFLINNK